MKLPLSGFGSSPKSNRLEEMQGIVGVLEPVPGAEVKIGHTGHRGAPSRSICSSLTCFEFRQAAFTQSFYCEAPEKLWMLRIFLKNMLVSQNVKKIATSPGMPAWWFTSWPCVCGHGGRGTLATSPLPTPANVPLLGKCVAWTVGLGTQHKHFPSHTQKMWCWWQWKIISKNRTYISPQT